MRCAFVFCAPKWVVAAARMLMRMAGYGSREGLGLG